MVSAIEKVVASETGRRPPKSDGRTGFEFDLTPDEGRVVAALRDSGDWSVLQKMRRQQEDVIYARFRDCAPEDVAELQGAARGVQDFFTKMEATADYWRSR